MKKKNSNKGAILFAFVCIFSILEVILIICMSGAKADDEHQQQFIREIRKEYSYNTERSGMISSSKAFKKKYHDMVGWIKIPDTLFSYPVMQTGVSGHHEEDNEYYLHRDAKGDYSFYGTPFLDHRCSPDSKNLIIYGHNINGRRYFGYLQNFRNETFLRDHPFFFFTDIQSGIRGKYRICSVIETDIHSPVYDSVDKGPDDSLSYTQGKDHFLTLSTCRTLEGRDKRLLVIGVKE